MTEIDDDITGKKVDINQYKGDENSYLKLINQGKKIDYIFNHKARYTNDINYEIYSTLKQGEDGTSENIKHIMPYLNRIIFKDKYFKLEENKPSRLLLYICEWIVIHTFTQLNQEALLQEKLLEFNHFLMIMYF